MSTRILLACGIVVGILVFLAMGDERASISVDLNNDKVTQESVQAIERALRSPTACDFTDVPLEEAMAHLAKNHTIKVWLDKQALQDEGITSDVQVSLVMSGITLQSALRLILKPHGLTHLTEDGVMKITTQAKADEAMSTRVYPVEDLVTTDAQSLLQVLITTTSGHWLLNDGNGGVITEFEHAKCLVIRQNQNVHQEIEGILAALREAKRAQPAQEKPTRSESPLQPH